MRCSTCGPNLNQALDGKRMVRALAGSHRPMQLGLATYKPMKQSRLTRVFMERCRAYISDQYIPGMSAAMPPRPSSHITAP